MKDIQEIKVKDKANEITERITGSEAIIRCLLAEGVDILYGYPGGAIMPVYDELYKYQDKIHHVLVRHEQCAAHAAQGYARISGKVGVAMATSGPGATNLITGIADAQIDSTPIVCITGQVASHLLGSDAFQETDIVGISTPVTKWNHQITKAAEIPEVIAKAFYIAKSGRPGPVLVDITKAAQFEEFDFKYEKCTKVRSYNPVPKTDIEAVSEAAKIINGLKDGNATITSGDLEDLSTTMKGFLFDVLGLEDASVSGNESVEKLEGAIGLLIELRNKARANKDFATSDKIRDALQEVGIQLKDGKEGTTYSLV